MQEPSEAKIVSVGPLNHLALMSLGLNPDHSLEGTERPRQHGGRMVGDGRVGVLIQEVADRPTIQSLQVEIRLNSLNNKVRKKTSGQSCGPR